jgi:hypothetical protein
VPGVPALAIATGLLLAHPTNGNGVARTVPLAQGAVNMRMDTATVRTFVALAGGQGRVATFDTATGRLVRVVPMPDPIHLAVDERAGRVFAGDMGSGTAPARP